jgi:hypothetical protein
MILEELNEITNDYFLLDDGAATDIYFNTSYLVNHFMKNQAGLWERPNGGRKIRVPVEYDESEGGWYQRNDPLSSDDREIIDAAYFDWKHAYGNATIYRTDTLMNAGEYAEVQLVTSKIKNAQKTARNKIAQEIYSSGGDSAPGLTGILSMCSETTTVAYGALTEDGLVAANGTKPWEGKTTATYAGVISLANIRNLASLAKVNDSNEGKPTVGVMTETLFNKVKDLLQTQQRFIEEKDIVKAGFRNLVFEGMVLAADDYCPATYACLINGNFFGFGIHSKGYFARTEWHDLSGPAGQTMKIFWDGNVISNNRKAHIIGTGLTAA